MRESRRAVEGAVAAAIERHALWPAGAPVVVAVSGGADSLCLLGCLASLHAEGHPAAPGHITVAHLDHALHPASADDAEFVAALAQSLGVPYVVERVEVRTLARAERRGLEDAARRARYAFLRRVAAEVGAPRIATGHTRDDQVETIVLHWLRGSGLAGLTGMAPLSGEIARPLLALVRAATEAYCAARGWQPRQDPTNADRRFLRNRVRHELLPLLTSYNPNLRAALPRNAALLAADEAYLEQRAADAWQAIARPGMQTLLLERAGLTAQPPALRHRLYRRAVATLTDGASGDLGLEARHIALLDQLIATGHTGAGIDLPGGLRAALTPRVLAFERHPRAEASAARRAGVVRAGVVRAGVVRAGVVPEGVVPEGVVPNHPAIARPLPLPLPGDLELPALGWRLRAWVSDRPPGHETKLPPAAARDPFASAGSAADLGLAEMRAYLDLDAAHPPLSVRTWQPGDRFRPLGMAQEKKLQDVFTDAKVPRTLRARLPLVFAADHLLWVAGLRLDDRAQVTPRTRRLLVLQLDPLEPRAVEGISAVTSADSGA